MSSYSKDFLQLKPWFSQMSLLKSANGNLDLYFNNIFVSEIIGFDLGNGGPSSEYMIQYSLFKGGFISVYNEYYAETNDPMYILLKFPSYIWHTPFDCSLDVKKWPERLIPYRGRLTPRQSCFLRDWCAENFEVEKTGRWDSKGSTFLFRDNMDAVYFAMNWSNQKIPNSRF